MKSVYQFYKEKLRTPEEAVKVVKNGDWVDYSTALSFPELLDAALAKRRDDLWDVKIRGNLLFGPIQVVECDPTREHFCYNSWHYSSYERALGDKGLCNYIPMIFRNVVPFYQHFLKVNVAMVAVTPMDSHGFFNLSCSTGVAKGIIDQADIVILEVNENLPRINGAFGEIVHICEVDYVVEGDHGPLKEVPLIEPTDVDIMVAERIMPYIPDGAVIQLGVGGMPNTIGKMLADSDLQHLSMHTELCTDAFAELAMTGKLTNLKKSVFPGKGLMGIAFGTNKLYEWLTDNQMILSAPLNYVNDPVIIGQMENMISINNCVAVDLYGQISSESSGARQISGTGGQLDFVTGSAMAKGGKSFICMSSTYVDKKGVRHSRIRPSFGGDIITSPRSQAHFIVTEFGCVNLAGRTTWERAEMLISIAHPMFRDQLIEAACQQGIWRNSNRR